MSQNASQNQTVLEPSEQPPVMIETLPAGEGAIVASGFSSVENSADRLMDELFEDVERILDGGVQVPPEPAKPEFVSLQPLSIPRMILPSMLMPRPPVAIEQSDEAIDELAEVATQPDPKPKGFGTTIDKLLLSVVALSVVAAGAVWFALAQTKTQEATVPAPTETASATATQPDAEFLTFLQQALERIDRKAEVSSQIAQASGNANNPSNLPTVTVPGAPQPGVSPTSSTLERVYIPVYQPPQPLALPSAPVLQQPIAPVAVAPAPRTAPAPVATAPVATAPVPANNTAPPNIAPAANHTLVGVLELGDRSAALFETNGVTQRIYPGEAIGGSGWTLVSLSNQQAIVRRNGEVRSIIVGQQF